MYNSTFKTNDAKWSFASEKMIAVGSTGYCDNLEQVFHDP